MAATMMMALCRAREGAVLERRPSPTLAPGEARLRVLLAGVCRTDLYAANGVLPVAIGRVLGHEVVAEVMTSSRFAAGTRVTVHPWIGCARCAECQNGTECSSPRVLGVDADGAFAEELCIDDACLHQVPRELSLRRAAYIEPIAASMAVLRAPITRAQRGVVLGTGRIATLTTRILEHEGFDICQLATVATDAGAFDYVIETNERPIADAVALVKARGLVVLKSRPPASVPFDLATAVKKQLTFVAVAYAPFGDALALAPNLDLDDLLGDVYPLGRFAVAFERANEVSSPKLFLEPKGG